MSVFKLKFIQNYQLDLLHRLLNWQLFSWGGLFNWRIFDFLSAAILIAQKLQTVLLTVTYHYNQFHISVSVTFSSEVLIDSFLYVEESSTCKIFFCTKNRIFMKSQNFRKVQLVELLFRYSYHHFLKLSACTLPTKSQSKFLFVSQRVWQTLLLYVQSINSTRLSRKMFLCICSSCFVLIRQVLNLAWATLSKQFGKTTKSLAEVSTRGAVRLQLNPSLRKKLSIKILTEESKPKYGIKPKIIQCKSSVVVVVWMRQFRTWYKNSKL